MRTLLSLLLLPALLLLTACGADDVAGPRARVLTGVADGAFEGELKFQAVDDGLGKIYDTQPLGDGVYVAPGAPSGKYRLLTTAGWGMLWTGRKGSAAPSLRGADFPAAVVRIGKPRSLYVASGMPGQWTIGKRWAAEWKRAADGGNAAFQRTDVQVEDQGDGILALRFAPEVWAFGNVVRILGLMTDGTVTQMESYQLRDEKLPDLPRMALMLAATQAGLTVHLVPPPGVSQVPDGTLVRVHLRGVALDHAYEARSFQGRARFEEIAALGHGLGVELPGSGPDAVYELDPTSWRIRGALHVVAVDPQQLARPELIEVDGGYTEALVCFRGGKEFGRVSFERVPGPADTVEGKIRLRTHPGWQEWWLKTKAGTWLHVPVDVPAAPEELELDPGKSAGQGVRVRGKVRGRRTGSRVVFRQVHEALTFDDGETVLPQRKLSGDGFEAAVSFQGGYEAHLPPARYEFRVVGPGGAGGRPSTLEFKPGGHVRLDLDAR